VRGVLGGSHRPCAADRDPSPDNTVHTSSGIRFIDLEQAALGNGYPELAYLRAGFLTCWCAVSVLEPACSQAEAAYHDPSPAIGPSGHLIRRDALVQRAHRDQPDYLTPLPGKDSTWGTVTARQRLLHRLTAVTVIAADHPQLRCLIQVSHAMRDQIQQRWPEILPVWAARENPSTTLTIARSKCSNHTAQEWPPLPVISLLACPDDPY